jgi:hypothetical protein
VDWEIDEAGVRQTTSADAQYEAELHRTMLEQASSSGVEADTDHQKNIWDEARLLLLDLLNRNQHHAVAKRRAAMSRRNLHVCPGFPTNILKFEIPCICKNPVRQTNRRRLRHSAFPRRLRSRLCQH